MCLGQFRTECIFQTAGHTGGKYDFVERVTITIEQLHRLATESQNLVALAGLHEPRQRLGMKTVGDDCQFVHGSLQSVNAEEALGPKHDQPITRRVPEHGILGKRMKRGKQFVNFRCAVVLLQRGLQHLHQIPESNRVLLILRMAPVRWLVE